MGNIRDYLEDHLVSSGVLVVLIAGFTVSFILALRHTLQGIVPIVEIVAFGLGYLYFRAKDREDYEEVDDNDQPIEQVDLDEAVRRLDLK
jgi:hypothetical protein